MSDGAYLARSPATLRARRVEVNGRQVWVLKDVVGILELADSLQILADDHPLSRITVVGETP